MGPLHEETPRVQRCEAWEKQYPVYDEIQTSVTADAGDAELIGTIIMDGKLVSFVTEPRLTCSFAYYG